MRGCQTRPFTFVTLVGLAVTVDGCKPEAQPAREFDVQPPQTSVDSIPSTPLSGTILGQPFHLKHARYFVDERIGYERLEISLSAGEASAPCDEPDPPHVTSLWIRQTGVTKPKPTTVQLKPNREDGLPQTGDWEVHYQAHAGGQWVGSGDAAAVLAIRSMRPDMTLDGELSVCFGDGRESCVSGSFAAAHCPLRVYAPVRGTSAMQRPTAVVQERLAAPSASSAPPTAPGPPSSSAPVSSASQPKK